MNKDKELLGLLKVWLILTSVLGLCAWLGSHEIGWTLVAMFALTFFFAVISMVVSINRVTSIAVKEEDSASKILGNLFGAFLIIVYVSACGIAYYMPDKIKKDTVTNQRNIESHGYEAARQGVPANANPFIYSGERQLWLQGYMRYLNEHKP